METRLFPATKRPVRAATIGVRGYGQTHVKRLTKLAETNRVELVAFAEPHDAPEVTELVNGGARWYQDYKELLAKEKDLDLLVISSPIALHEEMVKAALTESSIPRILLEKPAVPTIQQLDELIALDSTQRVRVGFQLIYLSFLERVKSLLRDPAAGRVRRVILQYGTPRKHSYYERSSWAGKMVWHGRPVYDGTATNACAHTFHLALILAAVGEQFSATPVKVRAELYRARDIEAHDLAWIHARTSDGVDVDCVVAHCVPEILPFRLTVETEHGRIFVSEGGKDLQVEGFASLTEEFPSNSQNDRLYEVLLSDQETFAGSHPTFQDVRDYTLMMSAALASSQTIPAIPSREVGEFVDVEGLSSYLAGFSDQPQAPSEYGFPWAKATQEVDCTQLRTIDFSPWMNS